MPPPKKTPSKEGRRERKSKEKKFLKEREVEIGKNDEDGNSIAQYISGSKDVRVGYATKKILSRGARDIYKEYKAKDLGRIKPDGDYYSTLICMRFENKNRYNDILCLDNTRVVLKDRKADSDYIHASWMTMPNGRKYISTQGPMEETLEDFWHMIVTEHSSQIVMLCALFEGKETKCERYFPKPGKDNSMKFGDYKVTYDQELRSTHPEKTIHQYKVTGGKLSSPFTVTHYIVNSWKDHSVPSNVQPITSLMKRVIKNSNGKPITVHCSAGIGRTSAFVALDYVNQAITNNPDYQMSQFLKDLRKMRFHAVQGGGQYVFVHAGLIDMWISEGLLKKENCDQFFAGYKKICSALDKQCEKIAGDKE